MSRHLFELVIKRLRTPEQRLGFFVNAFPSMSMDQLAELSGYKNGRVASSIICKKRLRL